MKNQFFYTRKTEEKEYRDSFNINKVIRTVTHTDESVIVILDDFNERVTQQPDIDLKTNKLKGYKNVRETVQSEIHLSVEDGERFFNLLNIE
jgi:malate synthase